MLSTCIQCGNVPGSAQVSSTVEWSHALNVVNIDITHDQSADQ